MSTEKSLQNIINLMERDDSVDAPADSIRWASNLFRTRTAEAKPSLLRKLVAVLQMEVAPNKPAFGERSGTTSAVRQMLYQADGTAIDIRIAAAKKGFDLRGQILGDGFDGAQLTLSNDNRSFTATSNETGEFRFDAIPTGDYELSIRNRDIEISLKGLSL